MLFKGTSDRPNSIFINKELDSMGGEHNAFTTKHLTGYHIKVPYTQCINALDILFDMVFNSLLNKKDMKSEQLVVLEEHKKSLDEPTHIHMITSSTVQKDIGLKYPIIGNSASIMNWKHKNLVEYKNKFYDPSNIVFSICGRFTIKPVLNKINKFMKKIKSNEINDFEIVKPDIKINEKSLNQFIPDLKISHSLSKTGVVIWTEKKKTEAIHCTVSFIIPGLHHEDIYALNMLSTILGGGMSSRLFSIVREKHGLAYTINSDTDYYEEAGEFTVYAGLDGKRLELALKLIIKEIMKLRKNLVTKEELQRTKKILLGEIELSQEDSMEIAEHYGGQLLFLPKSKILTFKQLKKKYTSKKITRSYLREIARKYIKLENLVVVLVGNCSSKKCVEYINKIKC